MKLWLLGLSLFLLALPLSADEAFEAFDLSELPAGVMITLPHPAHTVAPVAMQLRVQANDRAQVLKLSTLAVKGSTRKLPLAIYDQESKKVQRLTLSPETPFVYHFKSLRPVRIVPEIGKGASVFESQRLILESNRPLGISHGVARTTGSVLD